MSFLSGITDFGLSVLDKAPDIINAVNAPKTGQASGQATNITHMDAHGRFPGQPGYGTATPPGGVASASSLPAWVKPAAIAAGILGGVLLLWRLLRR